MNTTERKIDFIGIGAHKSATTWLAHVLRSHPDIWIPPAKEIHYFDREPHYNSPNDLATSSFLKRLTGRSPDHAKWRKSAFKNFLAAAIKMDFERLGWNLKYYTGTVSDDWYLSLFSKDKSKIVGEITPAYSMLTPDDIERVATLLPEVKIIYLLRDPIDRAWSHLRYDQGNGAGFSLANTAQMKSFIDSPTLTRRGDYLGTLQKWKNAVLENQIFVGYYDDIQAEPLVFLKKLGEFLGVDSESFPQEEVNSNVLTSQKYNIPPEIELYLATKYYNDLEQLATLLGSHTVKWKERAQIILKQHDLAV